MWFGCSVTGPSQVALNTVYLWGQGVKQCALTHSTAFAITNDGVGYTWGGTNKWWSEASTFDALAMDTNKVLPMLQFFAL